MRSSKIIVPHVSGDVKSIVICNTIFESVNIDPADITGSQILDDLTNLKTYTKSSVDDPTFFVAGDILTITINHNSFPDFNWNLIAFFDAVNPTEGKMLSKIWWDIPVKYEYKEQGDSKVNISLGGAKKLVLVYNSNATSEGNTELAELMTSSQAVIPHVLEDSVDSVTTKSENHPQLNGKTTHKVSLPTSDSDPKPELEPKTVSYGSEAINAYPGNSGETLDKSFSSTVRGSGSFTFNCIPSGIKGGKKLFVHPKYGVCLYDPITGDVFTIYSKTPTFNLPTKPTDITGDYDVYLYKNRVAVFYDYTYYSVYISSVKGFSGTDSTWETCWKLDEVPTGTSNRFKFLVPSYFNLIPIIFIHNTILDDNLTDSWYLMHITSAFKNFSTSFGANKVLINTNNNGDIFGFDGTINLFPSHSFFAVSGESSLVSQLMSDDLMGCPDAAKESIANNTYCRLYLSLHTLIQAIRFSKRMANAEYRIMDCGIWINQASQSWFIPYEPNIGGPAKTSNLIALTGTVLWIDNLCYLSEGITANTYTLHTMLGDDSTSITNVLEIPQMKNGVGIKVVAGEGVYSEL